MVLLVKLIFGELNTRSSLSAFKFQLNYYWINGVQWFDINNIITNDKELLYFSTNVNKLIKRLEFSVRKFEHYCTYSFYTNTHLV